MWKQWESAAARALRIRPEAFDAATMVIRLEPIPQTVTAGSEAIDPAAVLVLVDQALGVHLRLVDDLDVALLTIDLRLDWVRPPVAGQAVRCTSRLIGRRDQVLTAVVECRDGQGVVAVAVGQLFLGVYAGGETRPGGNGSALETPPVKATSFDEFLGIEQDGEDLRLAPRPTHIGAVHLPAFHGGVLAAACQKAGEAWLARTGRPGFHPANVAVHYLRPGLATAPLRFSTRAIRAGKSVCVLAVEVMGEADGRMVATAELTFTRGALEPRLEARIARAERFSGASLISEE